MIDSNKYTVRKMLLVSIKDVMTGEYHYSYRIISKPQDPLCQNSVMLTPEEYNEIKEMDKEEFDLWFELNKGGAYGI